MSGSGYDWREGASSFVIPRQEAEADTATLILAWLGEYQDMLPPIAVRELQGLAEKVRVGAALDQVERETGVTFFPSARAAMKLRYDDSFEVPLSLPSAPLSQPQKTGE